MACLAVLAIATAETAVAQPVTLRLGYGLAAEEPLWVVVTKPDLAKNYGKAYVLDATRFTGSDKRSQAFEAGAIDLAASSANGVIFAAAEGVTAKAIASISRESPRGFSTSYYVKDNSPIKSAADLKGKTVGINGFYTSGHLWLKTALEKNGLDDTDVTITPVPFPAMQEALEAGKVDVGMFPQPFRGPCGKTGQGAQNLRRKIWRTVRGGVDRLNWEGRIPEKECRRGARIHGRS
jgi:ABC-type nitrate/sulfonate/bicarbonate transport system substrate-binding protein